MKLHLQICPLSRYKKNREGSLREIFKIDQNR